MPVKIMLYVVMAMMIMVSIGIVLSVVGDFVHWLRNRKQALTESEGQTNETM